MPADPVGVEDRNDMHALVEQLGKRGIGSAIYYPIPVHRQPYVIERGLHADLPMTDRASLRTLSLPMFPGLSDQDQATVIAALRAAVERRTTDRTAQAMDRDREGAAAP